MGNRDSNIDNIVNINNIDNIDSGNLDDTGNDSGHNTLIKDDNSNKFVYQKQRVIKPSSMVDYKIDIDDSNFSDGNNNRVIESELDDLIITDQNMYNHVEDVEYKNKYASLMEKYNKHLNEKWIS